MRRIRCEGRFEHGHRVGRWKITNINTYDNKTWTLVYSTPGVSPMLEREGMPTIALTGSRTGPYRGSPPVLDEK